MDEYLECSARRLWDGRQGYDIAWTKGNSMRKERSTRSIWRKYGGGGGYFPALILAFLLVCGGRDRETRAQLLPRAEILTPESDEAMMEPGGSLLISMQVNRALIQMLSLPPLLHPPSTPASDQRATKIVLASPFSVHSRNKVECRHQIKNHCASRVCMDRCLTGSRAECGSA